MHRCLSIVEVQLSIFRQVSDNWPTRREATLARLARTCRTFNNAALDVLWENVRSFMYLIRCLPRDLWKTKLEIGVGTTILFQRAMTHSDWEIFFGYSSRIINLWLDWGSLHLGSDVVAALSQPPRGGPFTPKLKSLLVFGKNLSLLQMFLPHSLVELTLPTLSDEAAVLLPNISKHLIFTCSLLKTLHISARTSSGEVQNILPEMLSQLRSLESLICDVVDETLLATLSHLPSLLTFSGQLRDNLQVEKANLASPAFPSLVSLSLGLANNELSTLTSLFELVDFNLQVVRVVLDMPPTPDMLYLFFTELVDSCDLERLSHVSVGSRYDWPFGVDRIKLSLSTFEPLLAFSNMQFFEFDTICNLSLDDDAIDTLTEHWPWLTNLSLNMSSGWKIESGVTHRGLITLLSRCPLLNSFSLAVDFSEVDVPPSLFPSTPLGNTINSHCQNADFLESTIYYPASIAAFLSGICPKVEQVSSFWDDPDDYNGSESGKSEFEDYSGRWGEVNKLLPVFQAVRRQYTGMSRRKDE